MRDVLQRSIEYIRRKVDADAFATQRFFAAGFGERGLLTADETESRFASPLRTVLRNGELAFLGHPFERFDRTLDPVLTVIAVGRKQPDHFIGAARGRTSHVAGGKIDSLSNVVFMLQRPLHHAKTSAPPTVPACIRRLKNSGCIARAKSSWPVTSAHGNAIILQVSQ